MLGDISPSNINSPDSIIDREAFVDRRAVANTVSAIQDNPSHFALCIQRQHGLRLEKQRRHVERLKEDLRRLNSILVRIQWRFCEQNGVFLGRDAELVVDVSPEELHVFPVFDDAVLHGVVYLEQASVFVCLVAYENVLVGGRCDHHFVEFWAAHAEQVRFKVLTMN